jgi:plasmid stabilization system protein ParE
MGLRRCRSFLVEKNPVAARRAAAAIEKQFALLRSSPLVGRPFEGPGALRELVVGFGDSGYVALCRYVPDQDIVYVLAFRHQKEAGY